VTQTPLQYAPPPDLDPALGRSVVDLHHGLTAIDSAGFGVDLITGSRNARSETLQSGHVLRGELCSAPLRSLTGPSPDVIGDLQRVVDNFHARR
jgi:hypothetical protein